MICKELERNHYPYDESSKHLGANRYLVIHYENMITLTAHISGIIEICFQTKESWVKHTTETEYLANGNGLVGIDCFSDYNKDYHELLEIVWDNELLGNIYDYRIFKEQCKDQIVLAFVPWNMF